MINSDVADITVKIVVIIRHTMQQLQHLQILQNCILSKTMVMQAQVAGAEAGDCQAPTTPAEDLKDLADMYISTG